MSANPTGASELNGPDTILVSTHHQKELPAKRASLHVNIRGTFYFSGDAALTKAREVGQLVSELTRLGIPESSIELKGVFADVSSGMLGKTSSVNYEIKVRCASLDKIADAVGIITAQKNTTLRGIEWEYDGEDEAETECLTKCLEKANARARLIAASLGVKLIGVFNCIDSLSQKTSMPQLPQHSPIQYGTRDAMNPLRARSSEDFGTEFSHNKTISVAVAVTYRISGFEAG